MGLGLLIVPVLGGYLLLTGVHYTRYGVLRKSGYHLFFQSAIAGIVLARKIHQFPAADTDLPTFAALNAVRVLRVPLASQARSVLSSTPARPNSRSPCENGHLRALASRIGEFFGLVVIARLAIVFLNSRLRQIGALWKSYVRFDYSGTVALSVLLGFVIPFVANLFYGKEKSERRAATESGALIELVISESLDRQKPVEITLKNGKAYIGFALERKTATFGESDIALIPMKSGYRNKDTHELILTTDYISAIRKCLDDRSVIPDLHYEDFRVVVPMTEVGSVRIFHPEVYERFRNATDLNGA